MAHTDFILPGRGNSRFGVSFRKASLGRAFAESRATNPRNIEHPWYGLWSQILVDLTSQSGRLITIPQHTLYYTDIITEDDNKSESNNKSAESDNKFSKSEHDLNTSFSNPSVANTTRQPLTRGIVPDFAVIHLTFRWRDPNAPSWRKVKVGTAGVPLLVEIKRACSRSATSLERVLVYMVIAQAQAMRQAAFLFRMIPSQQSVMLMACTGDWWSCRIVTRGDVEGLEARDEEADFNPDECEDADDEIDIENDDEDDEINIEKDDEVGNELTDNELDQLEDEAVSAVSSAPDGWIELVEPVVAEADLELPTLEWTNIMLIESLASNQKLFLIHQRLEEVLRDVTRSMG